MGIIRRILEEGNMRKLLTLVILALFSLGACDKKESKDEAAPAEGAKAKPTITPKAGGGSMYGDFDAKAELSKLQGTWQVKDSLSAKSTWEINGDKLTRKAGDKVEEGKIEIKYPGKVAFVEEKGGGTQRSYYGYARNGEDVYIGLGKAGRKSGDHMVLAIDGLLVKQGPACKYYKKEMFGGFEKTGLDVKCGLKAEGEKQLFTYEVPDEFKKGEMTAGQVQIVGDALLDDQMMGNKAEKAAK
jgi:hypothetical protein